MVTKQPPQHLLHSLDSRYLKLLDALNIGFSFMDMNFGILEVNETFLKMVGGERDQVVGHHGSEFYTEEEFQKLYEMDLNAQQQSQSYQYEYWLPNARHNEKIPVLFSISTNFDQDGQAVSQYVMFSDIREQKAIQSELQQTNAALLESQQALKMVNEQLAASRNALAREKQMLETILFGIGDCVTVFDDQGQLLLSNPKGEAIRRARGTVQLPRDLNAPVNIDLEIEGEERQFSGQVETVCDHQGSAVAYAEILKETTDLRRLEQKEMELSRMKRIVHRNTLKSKIIGVSPAMQKIYELILRCAEVDSTVLVLGETGVGKELVARAIHRQSSRGKMPFVAVNCGALPDSLLESELFGHVKGAFTGAVRDHSGLFREANGGTLFLDEVGDLDIALQVKVLRALQEKEVRSVGGKKAYPVDVRVITATHHNLMDRVDENLFRADLYYRIAVIQLYIPPLRERKEDILPLAKHFIEKHNRNPRSNSISIDQQAQQVLLNADWFGNTRELENAIEHALAMKSGHIINSGDLPVQIVTGQKIQNRLPAAFPETNRQPFVKPNNPVLETPRLDITDTPLKPWQQEEKQAIESSLIRNKGNRGKTADELNISRSTLWRKMTMYRLSV